MISLMLAAAVAFGTDPSPEGLKAVHDMVDVSTRFCAAIYRGDRTFDLEKRLLELGFTAPVEREDTESGPYQLAYLRWWKPDRSLMLVAKLVDGRLNECKVYAPRTVWNQFDAQMPAYIKATGLPLTVSKDASSVYYGGGYKASITGNGDSKGGGTTLTLAQYLD